MPRSKPKIEPVCLVVPKRGTDSKRIVRMLFERGYITKDERRALKTLIDAFGNDIRIEATEEHDGGMIDRNRPTPPWAIVRFKFQRQRRPK